MNRFVTDLMSGQYKSHFKGHGVQFSEHRQYYHGDDIRHIDWNVSARSKDLLIKKFEEERELGVFIVVDVSPSSHFSSSSKLKSEVIAEIAGMLAYASVLTGDKVGVLFFSDRVEKVIPPAKGKQHVLRVIRDILAYQSDSKGTNLSNALDSANRLLKHAGVVIVLSDFHTDPFKLSLQRLTRKHEVVAVWVDDNKENSIPDIGTVAMVDPESGEESFVDTSSYVFKEWMKDYSQRRNKEILDQLKQKHVELLKVSTNEDYAEALVRFFNQRQRRRR